MKKVFKTLLIILIGSILYTIGLSIYKNARVKSLIKEFKSQAVEVEKVYNSNGEVTRIYYEVTSDVELDDETYQIRNDFFFLGNTGDIIVTQRSPFPYIPVVSQFIGFYFGGHAAMVTGQGRVTEIAGFATGDETIFDYIKQKMEYDENGHSNHDLKGATIQEVNGYFLNPDFRQPTDKSYQYFGSYYRKEVIGLRVVAPKEDRLAAVNYIKKLHTQNVIYNFLFFLDTKDKYYCTDIMSRSYQSVVDENEKQKYKLNDDGFITSVNDLILSKDTIISNYFELDDDGVEHIYYLVNK